MILIKDLGQLDYVSIWQQMLEFTDNRNPDSADEIWLLEHSPVFTLGRAGQDWHILHKTDIPIIKSDRGGQVTYHGPGQLVVYFLLDLKRLGIGIRTLVSQLENILITYLDTIDIKARTKTAAPGVYVDGKKIAALGLRVRKSCTLHGISLNVDMDLTPFSYINPCGYRGLEVCRIKDFELKINMNSVKRDLSQVIKESGFGLSGVYKRNANAVV